MSSDYHQQFPVSVFFLFKYSLQLAVIMFQQGEINHKNSVKYHIKETFILFDKMQI